MASTASRIPSLIEKQLLNQDKFLDKFKSELLSIDIEHKQTDNIVRLIKDLVAEHRNCIIHLLQNTSTKPDKIVGDVFGHCLKSLQLIDSRYKR